MRRVVFVFLIAFSLSGCFRKDRAQAIATLEALAEERAAQEEIIESERARFSLLIKAVEDGTIKKGLSEEEIHRLYGKPQIIKHPDAADIDKILVFAEPLNYFGTEKVYLYFDQDEKLVSWEMK